MGSHGVMLAVDLRPGCELIPGRFGHAAEVCDARTLIASERHMVRIHFAGDAESPVTSILVTASHAVVALKPKQARFHPVLASEVAIGDRLRTRDSDRPVVNVEHEVLNVAVVEVRLKDTKGSFFSGMPGVNPASFIELCGAFAPLRRSTVELLHFQRCDRFREIIQENPELVSCRNELENSGFGTDLGVLGLGNGKLLVRADLVQQTITALQQHCHTKGKLLTASDIVVSSELKPIVLEQIQRGAPRVNRVVSSEILTLGPCTRVRNTFVELSAASSCSNSATQSSTDAHLGKNTNPRKRSNESMIWE